MAAVPAGIDVARARLPQTYEAAKVALANCANIDECQDWANRAEALASYAKQADDDTLRRLADRIQARAVRRCGELLKMYDGRGRPAQNGTGAHTISRQHAAREAGLSKYQTDTAVRVANVPAEIFERSVESDAPPTVTKLADMGRQRRPAAPPTIDLPAAPDGFREATHLIGTVKRFAEFCRDHDPEAVARGVLAHEVREIRARVGTIDGWLDRFVINLGDEQ